jgi:hypothetical protein
MSSRYSAKLRLIAVLTAGLIIAVVVRAWSGAITLDGGEALRLFSPLLAVIVASGAVSCKLVPPNRLPNSIVSVAPTVLVLGLIGLDVSLFGVAMFGASFIETMLRKP